MGSIGFGMLNLDVSFVLFVENTICWLLNPIEYSDYEHIDPISRLSEQKNTNESIQIKL